MKTKSIGDMPLSEMTYRHYLISHALSGMVCTESASYEELGANVIMAVNAVISQLDGVRIACELSENQSMKETAPNE